MRETAERQGLPPFAGEWTVYYGAPVTSGDRMAECRRPNKLLRFAGHSWSGNPSDMRGEAMTRHVFEHEPLVASACGLYVADPCVGKGMTARMAQRFDLACLGMELNPKRLLVTLQWLEKQGLSVERISAS